MYRKDKNNGKKIFRASEADELKKVPEEPAPEAEPEPELPQDGPAPGGDERDAAAAAAPVQESPETAEEEDGLDPQLSMVQQLLTDGFRYRFKQVWKAIGVSMSLMMAALATVWFLTRPTPVNTIRDLDPDTHDVRLEDDYSGTKQFASDRLKAAYEANNDVVGWLTVDGCEIDDMVLQSADNSFYLRRNEEGRYSVWGCYFMDFINIHSGSTLYDKVTIIYGHSSGNSANGNKFSKLKKYRDQTFAKEHPYITFSMLYRELKWEVFACSDIPITINYIDPDPSSSVFKNTVDYMLSHSYVDFGVQIKDDDKILVLSTCTADPDVRFVLAARLVTD